MPDDINEVLDERGANYGSYASNASLAQTLKLALRQSQVWQSPVYAAQQEALEMICCKMARLANGSPYHRDSWVDIIGYATLALREIDSEQ